MVDKVKPPSCLKGDGGGSLQHFSVSSIPIGTNRIYSISKLIKTWLGSGLNGFGTNDNKTSMSNIY